MRSPIDIELIHYPVHYLSMVYLAGRGCYGMEDLGDPDNKRLSNFTEKIIRLGHESVLEHVNMTLWMKGLSRSFLAQLTRHRLASYSVKSQHYVPHRGFKYKPLEDDRMGKRYDSLMENIQRFYDDACDAGMKHYIAREVLPNACLTNIFMTANMREWRHVLKLRITRNNTPEIALWSEKVFDLIYSVMPEMLEDMKDERDKRKT